MRDGQYTLNILKKQGCSIRPNFMATLEMLDCGKMLKE